MNKAKTNPREFGNSLIAAKKRLDSGVSMKQEISLIEDFVQNTNAGDVRKVNAAAVGFFNWAKCFVAYADMVQPSSGKPARTPKNLSKSQEKARPVKSA